MNKTIWRQKLNLGTRGTTYLVIRPVYSELFGIYSSQVAHQSRRLDFRSVNEPDQIEEKK